MDFSTEPVLQVSSATIFQGIDPILSDVDFSIEQHEFVFLIGRTGSGKSSLLKTLYADLELKSGVVEIAGFDLTKIKTKEIPFLRRKIGIVFQDFQLFNDRTVAENLIFVMKATGWKDSSKIKARMAEVLLLVGLNNAASKMPHQLSGGEQQRVVIARALLNEPSILLADEPTGNLDPDVADGIFKLFQEINKKGTSILMATHNHEL
ncbi:ATP-binding cassette domain-containing protein, partial [Algoriphagus sp.]|uniref:cell division ATP-binding protein FtsE n=1 Tax=Algoriphagus sp. TaxID=1872435 RepID=UPI0025EABEBB